MDGTVCIIGAGGSGLAVAHALARDGVPFVVHEAREGVGGNWRYDPRPGTASAYASLRTNTSRWRTSYRAMPMSRRGPAYPGHADMLAYLEMFADRFDLRERIHFGSRVTSARPSAGGVWEVTTEPGGAQRHRALVVATGYDHEPREPSWHGAFDGLVLHTHDYRTPEPFTGLDVVVAGLGSSGAELACEIAGVARSVTIATRTPRTVMARRLGPLPIDLLDTEPSHVLLPWSVRRRAAGLLARLSAGDQRRAGLAREPRTGDTRLTVSDDLVRLVRAGKIATGPAVVEALGDRVRLADGREIAAQALLLAIGYQVVFPFLPAAADAPTYERAPLYRGIASPSAPNLFFAGVVNGQRALLPVVETQGEWIAAVLAGRLALPEEAAMRASIEADAAVRARAFNPRCDMMYDAGPYTRALRREARAARRRPGPSRRASKPIVVTR